MIRLKNVSRTFNRGKPNEVRAVREVNLEIAEGEFVVLVGANGSGKTTLLNLIAGSERPDGGQIFLNNHEVTKLPEYRRSRWIARVFQNPFNGTAPDLSILDNFRLAAIRTTQKGLTIGINDKFRAKVKSTIAALGMGLENKLDQPVGTLSGGQRQALTLIMSVMDETKVLLLDEPTAALDPKTARIVLKLAATLIEDYHLTAILITHNLKDAHQLGSRIIQMQEGMIIRDLDEKAKSSLLPAAMLDWFG